MKYFSKLLILLFVLLKVTGPTAAQQTPFSEYQVKAAFLFNFAKFVDWPSPEDQAPAGDFLIGILGRDPFGTDIRVLEGKSVKGQPLDIVYSDSLDGLQQCRVLFISASAVGQLPRILEKLRGRPVLTVGDMPGLAQEGVMINLFRTDNKIRFEINPKAAEGAGLKISSHLLRLARIVDPQAGRGTWE